MARNTRTGNVMEEMLTSALTQGNYKFKKNVNVGTRLGGGRHMMDLVAYEGEKIFLVSSKWQQTSGTAEQKIPFEVMCLGDVIRTRPVTQAYLVLGGKGWSRKEYFLSSEFKTDLAEFCKGVIIIDLEDFIAKANNSKL